jgi:signal transduction histidine kinase
MNVRAQDLVLPVLAAGAVVALIRARPTGTAKGRRGRLRELAWCSALLALSIIVARTVYPLFRYRYPWWWMVVPIVAVIIIAIRPRLAARIVPVALILYGLVGFVVARDAAFGGSAVNSYGVTAIGNQGLEAALILPQAYGFLLLGGWLALRSADPVLVAARLGLGPVARAPLGDQVRTLALLPVVAVLAGLVTPRLWLAGGAALIFTVALICVVVLLIRRWPRRAAQLATAGLLVLGIAGLVIAAAWHSASISIVSYKSIASPAHALPAPKVQPQRGAGKITVLPSRGSTLVAVPDVAGQPLGQADRILKAAGLLPTAAVKEAFAKIPAGVVIATIPPAGMPLKEHWPVQVLVSTGSPPPGFVGTKAFKAAPAPVGAPPAPAADFTDVAYGQALPFGAVLVSGNYSADAAAVEGLAFLALGAWLAPQTFPRIRRMLGGASENELSRRVERLTQSRAVAVDTASADLRRLERDLHDGAQARLVALGMSLRAAERLILTSPEAALALVAEARESSVRALTELRELVRGVLPPVLADRGLADAVRALALDSPLHVQTEIDLPGRLPAPVETACYFAVAELLTNAAKHSGARDARIAMSHSGRVLRIEVTDFGLGGADPALGSGMAGVEKRLATFDGILAVSSPPGGPTIVVMEVPCALSSRRTSSC